MRRTNSFLFAGFVLDEIKDSSKEPEERIVHPDCVNASNPYHECSEHCFKRIAYLKAQIERNESGTIFFLSRFFFPLVN